MSKYRRVQFLRQVATVAVENSVERQTLPGITQSEADLEVITRRPAESGEAEGWDLTEGYRPTVNKFTVSK